MKQFKSILLGISLFLLHSCNLLDVDTVSSITGDGYWNTKGDVESYMIGIYTKLRDTSNSTLHFEDRGDAIGEMMSCLRKIITRAMRTTLMPAMMAKLDIRPPTKGSNI